MYRIATLASILLSAAFSAQGQNSVEFEIQPVKTLSGVIRVAVYDHPDQWPHQPFRSYKFKKDSVQDRILTVTVKDLAPGEYAFTILDDENNSGGMEYNRLGIPLEGYGFGNNVRPFLKAPPYEKCTIVIKKGKNHIKLLIRH